MNTRLASPSFFVFRWKKGQQTVANVVNNTFVVFCREQLNNGMRKKNLFLRCKKSQPHILLEKVARWGKKKIMSVREMRFFIKHTKVRFVTNGGSDESNSKNSFFEIFFYFWKKQLCRLVYKINGSMVNHIQIEKFTHRQVV